MKEKQTQLKASSRHEITIEIRMEIKKKRMGKIDKNQNWVFEYINKIDEHLGRLTKTRPLITKIKSEKGNIKTELQGHKCKILKEETTTPPLKSQG